LEGYIVRAKDQLKMEVIFKVTKGQVARLDGQRILNVSERTLRRYLSRYENVGLAFLKHGNHRRMPVNKTADKLKANVLRLIREKYFDFNMQHLREKLYEELGQQIAYSTLRRWCH
jgi:transposase